MNKLNLIDTILAVALIILGLVLFVLGLRLGNPILYVLTSIIAGIAIVEGLVRLK